MKLPTFNYERAIWKKGYNIVAGCDEVGRGCFAGPVVAAAVAFAPFSKFHFPFSNEFYKKVIINDSKILTKNQRNKADIWIRENALSWGIGIANASVINKKGIVKAAQMAFRRAIAEGGRMLDVRCGKINKEKFYSKSSVSNFSYLTTHNSQLTTQIQYLLLDAFFAPYTKGITKKKQLPVVHGDTLSISIAAASIIAKVYRDNLMDKIGKRARYKRYKWYQNKGYGTKEHREAIIKYGLTGYHRKQFVETFIMNKKNAENAEKTENAVHKHGQ